jgi:hypothetical protein
MLNPIARTKAMIQQWLRPRDDGAPRFDGAHSRRFWTTREHGNDAWIEGYWSGRTHPLRQRIAETITGLDATSVIEIGCHCGPNLWAIAERKRYARLAGTELSPFVADAARRLLSEHAAQPVEIGIAGAERIPHGDRSFDVVLSAGMLICVGPDDIEAALREIVRVARRWIVLAEAFDDTQEAATFAGRVDPYPNTAYWVRNFGALLPRAAAVRLVSSEVLPREHHIGHLNSVLVFEKNGTPR